MSKVIVFAPFVSNHISNRFRYLQELGYDAEIVWPPAVSAAPFLQHLHRVLLYVCQVARARAEIYQAHYASSQAASFAFLCGKFPLLLSTMGGDILLAEQGDASRCLRWIVRILLRHADAVTAKSRFNRDIISQLGRCPTRTEILAWGPELSIFNIRERCMPFPFLPPHAEVVLQPRGLQPVYNTELILQAIRHLHDQGRKNVVLWLPKAAVSPEQPLLWQRVKALALQDSVFMTGSYTPEEMGHVYNRADLVVSIASSDGLPMTILEALATGTPVVVGKLPHFAVEFPGDVIHWTAFDVSALAQAMALALDAPKDMATKQKRQDFVRQHFNLQNDLMKYDHLLRRLQATAPLPRYWPRFVVLLLLLGDILVRQATKICGRKWMDWAYVRAAHSIETF
jgi:glycosyltransferase involved in cell wall biosynthesis